MAVQTDHVLHHEMNLKRFKGIEAVHCVLATPDRSCWCCPLPKGEVLGLRGWVVRPGAQRWSVEKGFEPKAVTTPGPELETA